MFESETASFLNREISVLMGGWSTEREISIKTGNEVFESLKDQGLNVKRVDLLSEDHALEVLENLDLVFIALHGKGGEDGFIQKLLEDQGIQFTGSSSEACKISINKCETKKVWRDLGLPTPDFVEIKKAGSKMTETTPYLSSEKDVTSLNKSFVVKPAKEGSSLGISIVHPNQSSLEEAMKEALKYDDNLIVEAFIDGEEITVPILDNRTLTPISIFPENNFYDFDAKYISNETQYLKSQLSVEELSDIKDFAWHAFSCLGCSGWGRIDLIKDLEGNFQLIEINTVPGLTRTSLFPKSADIEGIGFDQLILSILDTACL